MSDEEWMFFEHFILTVRARNGRKPNNHRLVLVGIFWIARTGAPWRDLREEFGKWSSVYRQFRRWTLAGLWEQIMDALNESGAVPDALQMIDSTVIRAHHPLPERVLRQQCPEREAAGAKGGLRDRVLAAQEVGSQPRSTSASMQQACL
ncbi:Putative transposase of IS4/5 family [Puniceibacterium sediminis]|uniref:Putative transposase of IS4/5 family n=1 Tax=Puniceibacterium sediminis TaxID=1608407 RepID=A0A238W8P6_9RHOB|nr:Putative transposase of IS4/5 family [Puniceibacterium sediminis]